MNKNQRSTLGMGVLLVLAGLIFLLLNIVPQLRDWINVAYSWPLIVLAVGAGLLLIGLVVGAPDMAVPAFVVGGIGGILYYQNVSGDWQSWSYLWTLIPGFSGIGMLVAWVLGSRGKHISSALDTIGSSLVLFVIFGAIFGAFEGFGPYWPVLLIAAGVLIGFRALIHRKEG